MAKKEGSALIDLEDLIRNLIQWNALEMQENKRKKEVYIPYVMNDAVECYLKFSGSSVQGILDQDQIEGSSIRFVQDGKVHGLIIHQSSGNMVTIWYETVSREVTCYQYHLIGHAWRKDSGEEYIRCMVNQICVLHDKRNYLGREYCADSESMLADLAEFPPVLFFTPINESILDWYPQSGEGVQAAIAIAERCSDSKLKREFQNYQVFAQRGKIKMKQIEKIASELLKEEHRSFWEEIHQMLYRCSANWSMRSYGMNNDRQIQMIRDEITLKYREAGYSGEYPNLISSCQRIQFLEEQAFTIMEESDFSYRFFSLHFSGNDLKCIWKEEFRYGISAEDNL